MEASQVENRPIEEVIMGVRKEKALSDFDRADKTLDKYLEENFGGDEASPFSEFVDELVGLCVDDEEWSDLVDKDWGDSMDISVKIMEREKELVETKGRDVMKSAHEYYRKYLVAKIKATIVCGGDYGMGKINGQED